MSDEIIYIRTNGKRIQISKADICYCEACGSKTILYFKDGSNFVISKTLKYFESIFDPQIFIRAHDKYLVNGDHIKEVLEYKQLIIVLKNGKEIKVSIRQTSVVNKFLNK